MLFKNMINALKNKKEPNSFTVNLDGTMNDFEIKSFIGTAFNYLNGRVNTVNRCYLDTNMRDYVDGGTDRTIASLVGINRVAIDIDSVIRNLKENNISTPKAKVIISIGLIEALCNADSNVMALNTINEHINEDGITVFNVKSIDASEASRVSMCQLKEWLATHVEDIKHLAGVKEYNNIEYVPGYLDKYRRNAREHVAIALMIALNKGSLRTDTGDSALDVKIIRWFLNGFSNIEEIKKEYNNFHIVLDIDSTEIVLYDGNTFVEPKLITNFINTHLLDDDLGMNAIATFDTETHLYKITCIEKQPKRYEISEG